MQYKLQKRYRLPEYDYSQEGCYFITICTRNQECYFGKIIKEKMKLSTIGKVAKRYWLRIPENYMNVELDEYTIMPNHIHGILIIKNKCRNTPWHVPTKNLHPLVKNSISSIINHYKGNIKRYCNKNKMEYFEWQSRFFDHIIRNEKSLNKIRQYIIYNPSKWEIDKNNPENLYM